MSIATEITRINNIKNQIRTKLINMQLIEDSQADLEDCTIAIENIYPTLSLSGDITVDEPSKTIRIGSVPEGYYMNTMYVYNVYWSNTIPSDLTILYAEYFLTDQQSHCHISIGHDGMWYGDEFCGVVNGDVIWELSNNSGYNFYGKYQYFIELKYNG